MNWSVAVRIAGIALASFFIGAAVFFGFTSGLAGVVMSPVLSLFGFYFVFPVAILVTVVWFAYSPRWDSWLQRTGFIASVMALGYGVGVLYAKGSSSELVEPFQLACAVSGAFAAVLVTKIKRAPVAEGSRSPSPSP